MKLLLMSIICLISLFGDEYSFKNNFNLNSILKTKEWNQLLYYKNGISEVNDKKFFLSENGQTSPKEELLATLNNYSQENVNDNSAVCLFPARYLFLSKYVKLNNYKKINENCTKLNKWEFLNKTDSISLILVSGYVSNPASTFGHSFIKLNTKDNDLFSSSINYGALVPNNEGILKYIMKGLTGFYEAGFSDKYFYTQDLAYTDTEFRDMWEYKLNLTKDEQDLILLHIWEIVGKKYDYYFLNKNCGFRVTEVLNLVSKTNLLDMSHLWFLPIETFQELESKEPGLIKEVNFIPSNKRIFNEYFSKLNDNQKNITKQILFTNFSDNAILNNLEEDDKIKILDFLILYYKQSLTIDNSNKILEDAKQKALIERFKYRVSNSEPLVLKTINSPAMNTNPIDIELSTGYGSTEKEFLAISFSPYKQSSLGISNLDFDNLTALDGRIGINNEGVFLDKFDLIKINKINLDDNNLMNEFKYNWAVHIGIELFNDKRKHFANFGIGNNIYRNNSFLIYSFLNGSINDSNYLSIVPTIGMELKLDKTSFRFTQEKEIGIIQKENKNTSSLALQYNFNKDYNISFETKYSEKEYKNLINFKLRF